MALYIFPNRLQRLPSIFSRYQRWKEKQKNGNKLVDKEGKRHNMVVWIWLVDDTVTDSQHAAVVVVTHSHGPVEFIWNTLLTIYIDLDSTLILKIHNTVIAIIKSHVCLYTKKSQQI